METSKWEELKKELIEMATNMEVTNDYELASKDMLHTILNEMDKIENEVCDCEEGINNGNR